MRPLTPSPDHASYSTFASFRDPDGNGWLLQEITTGFLWYAACAVAEQLGEEPPS